jgi:hypothetical protein
MEKYRIPFLAGGVVAILAGTTLVATPALAGVKGNYEMAIGPGSPTLPLTISRHHVFSDVSQNGVMDTGTWTRHGKTVTLTITASSYYADVGCVLSGTLVRGGINTPSSPGTYACTTLAGTWYAVESGPSAVSFQASAVPSPGWAG